MAKHFREPGAPAPQPRRRTPEELGARDDAEAQQDFFAGETYTPAPYGQQGEQQAYVPAPYADEAPRRARKKRRWPIALACVLILAAAGAGVYLYLNPPYYKVSINGAEQTVKAGATVQDVVDEGLVSPTAGDLIAIDGSVAQQGGGTAYTATVNGAEADGGRRLASGDQLQVDDGADVDEEYTEATETIACGESGGDYSTLSSYYNGSIHVFSAGEDGQKTVRTGKVSGKTVEEVTKQPTDAGYSSYHANVGDQKVIALTFDDGPWPTTTDQILDILKENGAHATFFQIGEQVAGMADTEKRIVEEGNQVATHTWDHARGSGQGVNLTFMSAEEQRTEVQKGFEAIESVLGTSVTHVLRAPGGNYYGPLVDNLKDLVDAEIGWDVDTKDWSRPGAEAIESALLSAKPGDVVLMHDGGGDRSQTVEALRSALPKLAAQGYKFVTVDELMAYSK